MPSLGDSAVIVLIGLLLFGPKGLAQIARQLGKLMGEFRRASNEFRMQMEEELRVSEQTERQKAIAAIEAAAPVTPAITTESTSAETVDPYHQDHPHMRSVPAGTDIEAMSEIGSQSPVEPTVEPIAESAPMAIATSGELKIMPPATGLPAPRRSSLSALIESVPRVDAPVAATNGHLAEEIAAAQKPDRYTRHLEETSVDAARSAADEGVTEQMTQESLHG